MRQIDARKLKQNTSRILAAVKAGETVEVTEDGWPVALLIPTAPRSEYDRLLEAGDFLPGDQQVPPA